MTLSEVQNDPFPKDLGEHVLHHHLQTPSHAQLCPLPENEQLSGRRLSGEQPRYIIVAMDFREGSKKAFDWTMQHLAHPGDSLLLLHAHKDPASEGLLLAAEQHFEKFVKEAREKYMIKAQVILKAGEPREVLCAEVTLRNPIALVVGSRGLSPLKRSLHGSVSDHCARQADCPVVIVRDR